MTAAIAQSQPWLGPVFSCLPVHRAGRAHSPLHLPLNNTSCKLSVFFPEDESSSVNCDVNSEGACWDLALSVNQ